MNASPTASPSTSPSSTALPTNLPLLSGALAPTSPQQSTAPFATNSPTDILGFNAGRRGSMAEYEELRKAILDYQPGKFAGDLVAPPPHMLEVLKSGKPMNVALFGFTGAGKSSVISLLLNAVKNAAYIDLVADPGTGELTHGTRNYAAYRLSLLVSVCDTRGLNFLNMAGDLTEIFAFIAGLGCLGYVRRPGVDDAKLAEQMQRAKLAARVATDNDARALASSTDAQGAVAAEPVIFSAAELRVIQRHMKDYKFDKSPGPLHAIALALPATADADDEGRKAKANLIRVAFALQAINYANFVLVITHADKCPAHTDWDKLRADHAKQFNLPTTKVFIVSSYTPATATRNIAAESEALRMALQMLRLAERGCIDSATRSRLQEIQRTAANGVQVAGEVGGNALIAAKNGVNNAITTVKASAAASGPNTLIYVAIMIALLAAVVYMWVQQQRALMLQELLNNGRKQ